MILKDDANHWHTNSLPQNDSYTIVIILKTLHTNVNKFGIQSTSVPNDGNVFTIFLTELKFPTKY